MYRRGAFQILALVLVVLVGSAVAQQITGTQLLVSGAGPHAIGGAPNANRQVLVTGTFSPPGGAALVGFYYDTTIVSPAGATDMYGFNFSPSFTKGTTGAHGDVSGFLVGAPAINSGGGAVVNNASSLKIVGAPTGGVNNYALLVGGGATLLGGTLWVRGRQHRREIPRRRRVGADRSSPRSGHRRHHRRPSTKSCGRER